MAWRPDWSQNVRGLSFLGVKHPLSKRTAHSLFQGISPVAGGLTAENSYPDAQMLRGSLTVGVYSHLAWHRLPEADQAFRAAIRISTSL